MCNITHGRRELKFQKICDEIYMNSHKSEFYFSPVSEETMKQIKILFGKEYNIEYDIETQKISIEAKVK